MGKKETLTIIKADIKREVIKKVNPKNLKLGNMQFKATAEVDASAAKELDTDARFVAKLYDDATKKYKECVGAVALRVLRADENAGIMRLTPSELKDVDKDINKIFEKYRKEIEDVTKKHFDKWKQANKDRKKYRVKVVGTIIVGSGCAIASTASLAAGTVTGGVSIAASIYGIAQSVVAVGRAIKRIASDITKVHKDLTKALKELVGAYENQSKAKDKKLDKRFEKLLKDRNYTSKKLPDLLNAMEKCRKATAKLIKDLEAWHIMLKPAEKFRDDCDKAVAALRHKDPVWAKWVVWIASLGLATGVSSIASGGENLVNAADGISKGINALKGEIG